MSESSGTAYTTLTIDPDPGFTLRLEGLEGTEELGRPFLYVVTASSDTAKAGLTSMLGSSVTVAIALPGQQQQRYINGIIARVTHAGLSGAAYRYHIEVRPQLWLLSRAQDCKIFQNQSPWAIINTVLSAFGISVTDKRQASSGSTTLEYCVQYCETSLDFITRLMERYGLYFYFDHADGQHTLVMADDPNSHTALSEPIPFAFERTEQRAVEDHVWDWSAEMQLQPGAVALTDYNFTTPSSDLGARSAKPGGHAHDSLEVFAYPGPHGTAAAGTTLADIRMQDLSARRQVFGGVTNARGMLTGGKFTLSNFIEEAMNQEYLVIESRITLSMAEARSDSRGELIDTYRNSFRAIPGATQFRLDRRTPWPSIRGPQTAKVTGKAGDEITTDQYGRIKVKFYWDRSAAEDDTSSCWIRVAQPWAGTSFGGMFLPRVGQEVVVEHLEGDPDRPIITGSVYNASVTVPYALPDNKTRSTIKTNSSTGGGGFNELRFEDNKGSEEVFFQAQKDYNKVVLNNETVKITQDTTTTVDKGNRSITVSQGNNSVTVSQGNNSLTVSQGNDSLTVSQGNHSITVSAGSSSINAGQSITLQVGSNSITIDSSGVTITAGTVSVTSNGTMSLTASGNMTIQGAQIAIN